MSKNRKIPEKETKVKKLLNTTNRLDILRYKANKNKEDRENGIKK